MKKLGLLICVFVILFTGCTSNEITYDTPAGTVSDMSNYNGLESNRFYDLTISEMLDLIDQQKTFIVYFGYDTCPWCKCLVPVLNEVSIEKEMPLYYMNFNLDENKNNVDGFKTLKELCGDLLETDEEGQLKLYFPTVFYVQQGTIIAIHEGTVSGHDATKSDLTEKQTARLKYNLEKEFDNLFVKN